jgi:hypothetical protein
MKLHWTWPKALGLTAAVLVAGGVAAAVSFDQDVSEPRLGAEWRCTRTALFVTTCTRSEDGTAEASLYFANACTQPRLAPSRDDMPPSNAWR